MADNFWKKNFDQTFCEHLITSGKLSMLQAKECKELKSESAPKQEWIELNQIEATNETIWEFNWKIIELWKKRQEG